MDHLEKVRKICLALPQATEKVAWGAPTFRVRNKMFAMFMENHHNDGRIALWCHAPLGEQEALVKFEPHKFFVPPYMGPRGWIGVHLNRNSDEEVGHLVRQTYGMVAPKKLQALLDNGDKT